VPNTSRMNWPYPSESQDPWFDAFVSLLSAIDASGYASREDRNLVLLGGGLFTFSASANEISWSAQIKILCPTTGLVGTMGAPTSPFTLLDGQVMYVNLTRNLQTNLELVPQMSNQVPSSDNALLLAIRSGNSVYFRNGAVLGGSGSPIQGGGVSTPQFESTTTAGGIIDFPLALVVPPSQYDGVCVFRQGLRVLKTASPASVDEYTVVEVLGVTIVRFGAAPVAGNKIYIDYWV